MRIGYAVMTALSPFIALLTMLSGVGVLSYFFLIPLLCFFEWIGGSSEAGWLFLGTLLSIPSLVISIALCDVCEFHYGFDPIGRGFGIAAGFGFAAVIVTSIMKLTGMTGG